MKIVSAEQVHHALNWPSLLEALHHAFGGSFTMPPRQVFRLDDTTHDAFALLPAWNEDVIAVKAFTYFPENPLPHPSLHSQILLFDRQHGQPLALIDGTSVTWWRTAAVSALASGFLSRQNSATLLLLGTGKLAPYLIRAHAFVRPLTKIIIWGRSPEKVEALMTTMRAELPQISFSSGSSIEDSCGSADIVVAATGSHEILVKGDWIRPGTHTDFLGNHHADKRECDTELVTRSRVYVDTFANCFKEAGELLIPINEGRFSKEQVIGELADLCSGKVAGRQAEEEITLFKSVGAALGDLAAARMVWLACAE